MGIEAAPAASTRSGRGVFTTVIGRSGGLAEQPAARDSSLPYVCLTDDPDLRSDSWQLRMVSLSFELDPIRSQRDLMIRAHRSLPELSRSLYIDSSVELKVPAEAVFELLPEDARVGLVPDHVRESVLDDFLAAAELGLDDSGRIFEQMNHYQLSAPEVLAASSFVTGLLMVREHADPAVQRMEQVWFEQVLRYSHLERLSVNAALRHAGLVPHSIELDTSESDYHRWPRAPRGERTVMRRPLLSFTPASAQLRAAELALAEQTERAADLQRALAKQAAISASLLDSRSWRLLAPLRRLGRAARRVTALRGDWRARLGLAARRVRLRDSIWYAYFPLLYRLRRRTRGRRWLVVAPGELKRPYLLWKVTQLLGVDVVRATDRHVPLAVRFDDITYSTIDAVVADVVINGGCADVSKRRVEEASLEVFGYGIAVDPTRHVGPMVVKSNENARHDGSVIDGPIAEADPSMIYQRVLDNEVLPGIVEDLRTTVVAGKVLAVWRKRRALHERFANVGLPAHALHPESVLTASEREQAAALACNMGLDMCEMDIIRDRVDGRIYVIDVNQTPYSPPGTAHGLAGLRVMHRVAAEFEREWGTLLGRSEA